VTAPTEVLSYIQTALTSGQTSAVLTQNANGTWAISVDIGPGKSYLTLPLLQGNEGTAGQSAFPLMPMMDIYDSNADLPAIGTLTNTVADIGKFWIIYQLDEQGQCTSTGAYIWFGTEYRFLPFGSQGPEGAYPVIVPLVELLEPERFSQPVVNEGSTGAPNNPYLLTMELSIPQGPQGPSCPLGEMFDVDEAIPPLQGQFLAATSSTVTIDDVEMAVWSPADVGTLPLMPYSVPQSAFVSTLGITFDSIVTIAAFTVPPQPFPWKPVIFGQIQMWEFDIPTLQSILQGGIRGLLADIEGLVPFQVGIEVMLGSPTGTMIGRGFGNSLTGAVTIMPHCSAPGEFASTAMTPGNDVGLVPANTTGPASSIYVNVINDGLATIYDYNSSTAELFVLACPVTEPLKKPIPVAFNTKVTFSATVTEGS
jgi:hypothetical protein